MECHGIGKTVVDVESNLNLDKDNMNILLVVLLAGRPGMLDTLVKSVLQLQVADVMVAVNYHCGIKVTAS